MTGWVPLQASSFPTGHTVTAAEFQAIITNLNATAAGRVTTAGQIIFATGPNAIGLLAKPTATGTLFLGMSASDNSPTWQSVPGGVSLAQVDARILEWARTGNTDIIPPAKIAGGTPQFGQVPAIHRVNNELVVQWTTSGHRELFAYGTEDPSIYTGTPIGSHFLRTINPPELWYVTGSIGNWIKVYTWPEQSAPTLATIQNIMEGDSNAAANYVWKLDDMGENPTWREDTGGGGGVTLEQVQDLIGAQPHRTTEEFQDQVAQMFTQNTGVTYDDSDGQVDIEFPAVSASGIVRVYHGDNLSANRNQGSDVIESFTVPDMVVGERVDFYAIWNITTAGTGTGGVGEHWLSVSNAGVLASNAFGAYEGDRNLSDTITDTSTGFQHSGLAAAYLSYVSSDRTLYIHRPGNASNDSGVRFSLSVFMARSKVALSDSGGVSDYDDLTDIPVTRVAAVANIPTPGADNVGRRFQAIDTGHQYIITENAIPAVDRVVNFSDYTSSTFNGEVYSTYDLPQNPASYDVHSWWYIQYQGVHHGSSPFIEKDANNRYESLSAFPGSGTYVGAFTTQLEAKAAVTAAGQVIGVPETDHVERSIRLMTVNSDFEAGSTGHTFYTVEPVDRSPGGGGGGDASLSDETPLAPTAGGDAGDGTAASRDDHQHPPQSVPQPSNTNPRAAGNAEPGSGDDYSRHDHRHPPQVIPQPSDQVPVPPAASGNVGTALAYARGDHRHQQQSVPQPADTDPVAPGTASQGTSGRYARQDHRHPEQTLTGVPTPFDAPPFDPRPAPVTGVSEQYSRGDHVHREQAVPDPSNAAALALGIAAAGTDGDYARSDHVHPTPGNTPTFTELVSTNMTAATGTAQWNTLHAGIDVNDYYLIEATTAAFSAADRRYISCFWFQGQNMVDDLAAATSGGTVDFSDETTNAFALQIQNPTGTTRANVYFGRTAVSGDTFTLLWEPRQSVGSVTARVRLSRISGSQGPIGPRGPAGTGGGGTANLSDDEPQPVGPTASPGSSSEASRSDHVHVGGQGGGGTPTPPETLYDNRAAASGLSITYSGNMTWGQSINVELSRALTADDDDKLLQIDYSYTQDFRKSVSYDIGAHLFRGLAVNTKTTGTTIESTDQLLGLSANFTGAAITTFQNMWDRGHVIARNQANSNDVMRFFIGVGSGTRTNITDMRLRVRLVDTATGGGGGTPTPLSNRVPQSTTTGTGSAGTGTSAARDDHVHHSAGGGGTVTFENDPPLAPAATANAGTVDEAARGDHVHPEQTVPVAYTGTPERSTNQAGSPGSSDNWARGDHRHPLPTGATFFLHLETGEGGSSNPLGYVQSNFYKQNDAVGVLDAPGNYGEFDIRLPTSMDLAQGDVIRCFLTVVEGRVDNVSSDESWTVDSINHIGEVGYLRSETDDITVGSTVPSNPSDSDFTSIFTDSTEWASGANTVSWVLFGSLANPRLRFRVTPTPLSNEAGATSSWMFTVPWLMVGKGGSPSGTALTYDLD